MQVVEFAGHTVQFLESSRAPIPFRFQQVQVYVYIFPLTADSSDLIAHDNLQ